MNCKNVRPKLSEYIDDQTSARATFDIKKHLLTCNYCANELNELRKTVHFLHDVKELTVSMNFEASLQKRLMEVQSAPPKYNLFTEISYFFQSLRRPSFGLGYVACALGVCVLLPLQFLKAPAPAVTAGHNEIQFVHVSRTQAIALTASDPFGDTAAASMAASNQIDSEPASGESSL